MKKKRSFLMLQGPVGPCFKRLAAHLAADGHKVTKVNLWGGDVLDFPSGIPFWGTPEEWPEWIQELAAESRATDLLLFGDRRPAHAEAIAALRGQIARIHVLEEGYLRPDWITLDQGGANADSGLPRSLVGYQSLLKEREQQDSRQPVGSQMTAAALRAVAHYAAGIALRPVFPHHRPHRRLGPLTEATAWTLRYLSRKRRREDANAKIEALCSGNRPFYVLALQLETDSQLRDHSDLPTHDAVLDKVLAEFAASAPASCLLAVKAHPLEPWPKAVARLVATKAQDFGLSDRVVYLADGALPPLLNITKGLVCVNSTAALQALPRGVPVMALGRAFWKMPGITAEPGTPSFWVDPVPPSPAAVSVLLAGIRVATQINGGFYSGRGLELALPGLATALSLRGKEQPALATTSVTRPGAEPVAASGDPLLVMRKMV